MFALLNDIWVPGKVDVLQQRMMRPWRKEKNPALCIYLFGYEKFALVSEQKIADYKVREYRLHLLFY